jgi:hypothetical protein
MKIQSNYSTPSFGSRVIVKNDLADLGNNTARAVESAVSALEKIGSQDTDTAIVIEKGTKKDTNGDPMLEIGFGKIKTTPSGDVIQISGKMESQKPTTSQQVIDLAREAFSKTDEGKKETQTIIKYLLDRNQKEYIASLPVTYA